MFDALDRDRYTYASVDIRGYGHSRDVAGTFSISEVAADGIALADQLGSGISRGRPFHGRRRSRR
jgi:pimeloyl-ACP methyl ester carboxylesterase